jgi:hypothetical protein
MEKVESAEMASEAGSGPGRFQARRAWMIPLLLGAAICWTGRAPAADAEKSAFSSDFSIQGFGTLGAARSTNGDVGILRSIRQPRGIDNHWSAKQDSLLGIQAQYRFNDQVGATLQAASYYNEHGSFKPNLTAAYLKFDLDPRFFVRIGRVPLDLLMLADTRMVGYSYIPIRPVSEAYNVPMNYVDGASARWNLPVGEGVLSLDAAVGLAREAFPRYDFSGTKTAKGGISYEVGSWQFRYFYARAKLVNESDIVRRAREKLDMCDPKRGSAAPPECAALNALGMDISPALRAADKLSIKGTTASYQSLGLGYDDGAWQMQFVLDGMRYETPTLPNGKGFHAFIGRRVGDVTPYVGYSRSKTKPKTLKSGLVMTVYPPVNSVYQQINDALDGLMKNSGMRLDSETFTLGARWDFRRNMALKAQVDYLRGGKNMVATTTDMDSLNHKWNGKATIFSVSMDFVF